MQDLALLQRRMNRSQSINDRVQAEAKLSPVVTYSDRDPVTGHRNMVRPDGSIDRANKLDNADPSSSPGWYMPGRLGLPAQISSRSV